MTWQTIQEISKYISNGFVFLNLPWLKSEVCLCCLAAVVCYECLIFHWMTFSVSTLLHRWAAWGFPWVMKLASSLVLQSTLRSHLAVPRISGSLTATSRRTARYFFTVTLNLNSKSAFSWDNKRTYRRLLWAEGHLHGFLVHFDPSWSCISEFAVLSSQKSTSFLAVWIWKSSLWDRDLFTAAWRREELIHKVQLERYFPRNI